MYTDTNKETAIRIGNQMPKHMKDTAPDNYNPYSAQAINPHELPRHRMSREESILAVITQNRKR